MFKNKKTIYEKIDNYLVKRGHEVMFSIFLDGYNGNDIYIRLDYVHKVNAYKVVWVDMNFLKEKHMADYINMQVVTKFIATKMITVLSNIKYESNVINSDRFMGDRVEVINYFNDEQRNYIFDRYLPLEWKDLIDIFVLIFSYLPRGMEVILNEMFAKFDMLEEYYTSLKPIRFNLLKQNMADIMPEDVIEMGKKEYGLGKVTFLEYIGDKYIAVVDERKPIVVVLSQVNEDFAMITCGAKHKTGYCKHVAAVIIALRAKKFNKFYKVRYTGLDKDLLTKVTDPTFGLCFGVEGDNLLLVNDIAQVSTIPIVCDGKVVFDVIEDDDECSLSKIIKSYKLR